MSVDRENALPSFRSPFFSSRARWALVVVMGAALILLGRWWWTSVRMPGESHRGALAPLDESATMTSARLRSHVELLAQEIGARSTARPAGLGAAEDFVRGELESYGYEVEAERFESDGVRVANLVAERRGASRASEVVVVGAHYDSIRLRPGANDNASGTAALLELARAFASASHERTIRFVAFTNEEPPHFRRDTMGSLVHARRARERGDEIVAMLSLESLGHYDSRPGTQRHPFFASLFYPDRGDFVAFVGRAEDATLVRRALSLFRAAEAFPSEGFSPSERTEGVGWSDHWSF